MEPVFPFDLVLPERGEGTLTEALHRQLRAAILEGRLAAGSSLPATRRAAAALGIARNTVTNVYDLLVAEGCLQSRRGAKPVVSPIARPATPRMRSIRPAGARLLSRAWRRPFARFEPSANPAGQSFRLGIPEHRYFPHETWRRLSARALRALARQPFRYPPTEGIAELRGAIAQHVAFTRAVSCRADDVIVTSGAQQAFDLVARMLVTPGETTVVVEEPGYPPLLAAFAGAGARLVPVTVDEEGLCVGRLPAAARIVCVTPSHQAPTGVALSLQRRLALLEFARANDAVILEDDYDGEFLFGGRPIDALQMLDRDGRVFYVGTFSKSLFPGLRKGYVVSPAWAREALTAVKHCADSHSDLVTQSMLAAFIREGHLARHIRRMRALYAERREALLDGLAHELSGWLEPIPAEVGLFLGTRIRDPAAAHALIAKARIATPGVASHADYAMRADCPPGLSFGYGVIDAKEIGSRLAGLRRALGR
jgi:GntR family transcriptional regulator/MocR family aminotransferase